MGLDYCTTHRWEDVSEFKVDVEQRDLLIVTDANGNQHSLLRGRALERQRARTPEPRQWEPIVETAPVVSVPTPSVPDAVQEPEPIPEIVEAIVGSFDNGSGIARITRRFKREGFVVIRINAGDVITEGKLTEGVLIRCRVGPPDADGTLYNARQIEIYQDLSAQNAEGETDVTATRT